MTDRPALLVIGYGNDLRSDDGAGRLVADRVEAEDLADVEVRSVSQLAPELALAVAGRTCVIFVDADVDVAAVTLTPVVPVASAASGLMSHHGDPAALLALAETVGDPPGAAWLVSIPAADLGLGFDLSPATARGVEHAVKAVIDLLRRVRSSSEPGRPEPSSGP